MRNLILIIIILSNGFAVFAQNSSVDVDKLVTKTIEGDSIYRVAEQMPEFRGGGEAMAKYVNKNLRYPAYARQQNIQGTVLIRFVVGKTGKVTDVTVLNDIHYGCGKEAMRVIKSMPDWKPV